MLRFYKKLEQNFLNLSGFSKYIIYGFTEIALLIVGIVIALQVNTWGQNRADREMEVFYLSGILDQIESDINEINTFIEENTDQLNAINYLLGTIGNEHNYPDSLLEKYWSEVIILTGFTLNTTLFDDLKSSGRLSIISSDELRINIQSYYASLISAKNIQQSNDQLIYNWFNAFFLDPVDLNSAYKNFSDTITEVDEFSIDRFQLFPPSEIIDRLSAKYALLELNNLRYNVVIEHAEGLKKELENYLDEQN